MKHHSRFFGFTLAEVLITLGIIGIVAALTISPLISKYNEIATITALKKTYSELSQAIKLSEVVNGDFREWDYGLASEDFATKYIMPYLTRDYTYIGYMKFTYTSLTGTLIQPWTMAQYYYNDKAIAMLVHQNNRDGEDPIKYVDIYVDINGNKGQGIMGKDVFEFTLFNYSYYYGGWNGTPLCPKGDHYGLYQGDNAGYWGAYCGTLDDMFGSSVRGNCKKGSSGANCGLAIEKNGWEIPDKYPIKF